MNRRRTILISIIFIPLLLLVPINIIMLYNASDSIENAKKQILSDNYSMVSHYVTLLEQDMMQVESYMNMLVNEEYSYLALSEYSFHEEEQFYQVQNQLISEFNSYLTMNNEVKCIAAFFEGSNTYIIRDKMMVFEKIDKEMQDFLRNATGESKSNLSKSGNWHYIEIDEKLYMVSLKSTENARCAVVFCLDDILREMEKLDFTDFSIHYFAIGENNFKVLGQESSDNIFPEGNINRYQVPVYGLDLQLGGIIYEDILDEKVPGISKVFLLIAIIACSVAPIISILFYYLIERPLKLLNSGMDEVKKGHTDYRIPIKKKTFQSEFDDLNVHFNSMLEELEDTKLKLFTEEINRQKIQLRYLNQQIRPHFVLNALNIIYTYEDDEFPIAKKMVLNLVKYFQYLVNLKSDYVFLWEEMEHTDNYLKIQKTRYPKRFTYFVEWEEELRFAKIPAVIIQTFVENSIKYGFEKGKSMFLFVLAKKIKNRKIKILIADTGKGFENDKLNQINEYLNTKQYDENLGVGIQNVVNRLEILYGVEVELKIFNADDGGARVEIIIPFMLDEISGGEHD